MACPYFYPVERHTGTLGAASTILPLGDAWSGLCRAAPGAPWKPDEALLHPVCSLGYARGRCPRFPADDAGADAVRFAISADHGDSLALYCVQERDHHPFAHGPLEYSLPAQRLVPQPANETMGRQAEAYVESYLRRKRGAAAR